MDMNTVNINTMNTMKRFRSLVSYSEGRVSFSCLTVGKTWTAPNLGSMQLRAQKP